MHSNTSGTDSGTPKLPMMSATEYTNYQPQHSKHDSTALNNIVHNVNNTNNDGSAHSVAQPLSSNITSPVRRSSKRGNNVLSNTVPSNNTPTGSAGKLTQPIQSINTPLYDKMPSFVPTESQQFIPNKRGEQSNVWNVFRIIYNNDHYVGGWVWCTLGTCKGWVKRGGNGTSAMQNHIKHNHGKVYDELYHNPHTHELHADESRLSLKPHYHEIKSDHNDTATNNDTLLLKHPTALFAQQPSPYGADYTHDPEHPRRLIPELCKQFYTLGWVTGTGGGISIRYTTNNSTSHLSLANSNRPSIEYYIAPSSVQKERMCSDDMYVLDSEQNQISGPPIHKKLSPSQCTPLFFNAYNLRDAGCCIHTHSQSAVLCTLLYDNEYCITHQEMIKGIKIGSTSINYKYYDNLIIPIIENTAEERDLKQRMYDAMIQYPYSNAVLVRRHGLYVWGNTWQSAKTQCECYDYLFSLTIQLKHLNIDPTLIPNTSEYKSNTIQYKYYTTQQQRVEQYNNIHNSLQQLNDQQINK